jgi:hypothetical protein
MAGKWPDDAVAGIEAVAKRKIDRVRTSDSACTRACPRNLAFGAKRIVLLEIPVFAELGAGIDDA